MDKFAIYAKAANFNGKILFLVHIYRSASVGLPRPPLQPTTVIHNHMHIHVYQQFLHAAGVLAYKLLGLLGSELGFVRL